MTTRGQTDARGVSSSKVPLAGLAILIILLLTGCGRIALPTAGLTEALPTSLPVAAAASPPFKAPPSLAALQADNQRLYFNHLPPDTGLSQSVVADFVQDRQGFLWLATQDGLNRYDGGSFKIFKDDPEIPGSIKGNFVSSLDIDSSGAIWAGTNDGGLNRYDPQTGLFASYQNEPLNPNSLSENSVSSLVIDGQDQVWAGTNNGGVNRLNPQIAQITRYQNDPEDPDSLSSNNISSLQVDHQGMVWVGTIGGGLNRLDPTTSRVTRFSGDALGDTSVQTLYVDRQGTLWVGTFTAGLSRYDPQTSQFIHYQNDPDDPASLAHNSVASIFEDQHGNFWVGTQGGGLSQLNRQSGQFTRFQNNSLDASSLSNNYIVSIFEDRSGILWLGTFGSGADFYDPAKNKFLLLRSEPGNPQSLSNSSIWSIYQDSQGILWIGTSGGGLNRYNPTIGEWKHYLNNPANPNSLSSDWILSTYQDDANILWLGTANGLNRFDPQSETFTYYALPIVIDIYRDRQENFWLGTGQGLLLFDPQDGTIVKTYQNDPNNPTSLSSSTVSALLEDTSGNLWVGTLNGGLNRFDRQTERFVRYTRDPSRRGSLSGNSVLSIYQSQDGTLWIGTGSGLNRYDPQSESFGVFREKDGLPNDFIYGILEDDQGNLWLSTNKGIARFNPSTNEFKNYDTTDGLQGPEFNQGAYYENPEGVMFFGGVSGLNAFHPAAIQDNPFIPPVVITGFEIYHQPVEVGPDAPLQQPIEASQAITLTHTDDFFEFEFASLHFSSPEEIQYAYRMDDLDKDWNYVQGNHFASYTNVPPGEYTFQVIATNSDGVWNEQGSALSISIPPPFWQTVWFRVLLVVAVIGAVSGVFLLRLRAVEAQRKNLEIQVEQRTHELRETMVELEYSKEAAESASRAKSTFLANMSHEFRTPLNAILGFTQIMLRDRDMPDIEKDNAQIIHRSSEHLLGLINDVLEMSKIEAGRATLTLRGFDLHRMLKGLHEMFAIRAESKGIVLRLELAPEVPRYIKSDEGKLRQVLMNLLGNAVKFTEQGHVILRVHPCSPPVSESPEDATWLCFAVEDTGPGISQEDQKVLFTPFVQTSAGRESPEGTGLGLPISQQHVRLMGGEIQVSSQVGNGSIFKFALPVEPVLASDLEKPPPTRRVVGLQPGQPEIRMLLVDDQEVNRRLLAKIFSPLGFELREAANGKQALEIWETWEPHLIWMDMRMPVMDGYEATRRIKATTRGMATIIIALTASALEEDRAVILSEGCDDYIRKPFHEEDLFEAIARHLGVQYVYEELEQPLKASAKSLATAPSTVSVEASPAIIDRLKVMDPGWLDELEHATILGDLRAILYTANQAAGQDPILVEEITSLANQFDHDRILSLIQAARNPEDHAHTDQP